MLHPIVLALVALLCGPEPGAGRAVEVTLAPVCEAGVRLDEGVERAIAAAPSMRARVDVRALGAERFEVVVEVTTEGQRERRTFEAPSCTSALDAAAVVIAVAIEALQQSKDQTAVPPPPSSDAATRDDGTNDARATPASTPASTPEGGMPQGDTKGAVAGVLPATSQDPQVAGEVAAGGVRPAASARSRPHGPGARGGLYADAGIALGIVPGPAASLRFGGSLWIGRVGLRVTAVRVFPGETPLQPQGVLRVAAWGGAVSGGFEWRWPKLAVPVHAGVLLAGMEGDGRGVPGARSQVGFYGAALAGAGVRYTPHRLVAFGPEVAFSVAFARPRFGVESAAGEPRESFQPAILGLLGVFALELRFP